MNTFRTRSCSRSVSRFRFSPAAIRARKITGSNGFGRKSSAPASRHRTTLSLSSTPEIMITGMWRVFVSDLIRSRTSIPSSPGITTSSSTTSGGSASSAVSAAKPLSTSVVRWPSLSRLFVRTRRFNGSSSTMRMCPGRACIGSPASGATERPTDRDGGPPSAEGVSHVVRGPSNSGRSWPARRPRGSSRHPHDLREGGVTHVPGAGYRAGSCVPERHPR